MQVRHEEAGAFAAAAEAELTGRLAVCAGSCGPGNLHLINGLYDANRSRVPVLAIASHIPSSQIGTQYFQETHPDRLFTECSVYSEMISTGEQAPRVIRSAIHHAYGAPGVAVLTLPGDVADLETTAPAPDVLTRPNAPRVIPAAEDVQARTSRRSPTRSTLRARSRSSPGRARVARTTTSSPSPTSLPRRSATACAARSTSSTTTPSTSA